MVSMFNTPNYDAKVKLILETTMPGERTCALTGEKWVMTDEEIGWYKKFNVPPSRYSPNARMKLVMGYFVLFDMWYNKHADTGASIISTTHPASGIRVLPDSEWFARDFSSHGQDVEVSASFFDQLYSLSRRVPIASTFNYKVPENSVAFISLGDQDSYFVLACRSKRSFFCGNAQDIEDSAELVAVENVRQSYAVVHSQRIFKGRFLLECYDCIDSSFLFDCRNCESCFGATNQRNKKYLWFNEQLSQEEWQQRFSEIDLRSQKELDEMQKRFAELMHQQAVWPENFNINAVDSSGEYINESTNVRDGYYVMRGCRDLDNACYAFGLPSNDCYTVSAPIGASDCYYGIGQEQCSQVRFAMSILSRNMNTEYCNVCYDVENCFGCVGLRHKKFCILNKQYSEGEYWQKLDELKCAMLDRGEYGELPPLKFSTQRWSGSGAHILYGASKEECLKLGAVDFAIGAEDAEGPIVDPSTLRSLDTLPDRIEQPEEIIGKPYYDAISGRRFGYQKAELDLYNKLGIAPPRKHPTRRLIERYQEMNIAVFENAQCEKCHQPIHVAKNMNYPDRKFYCRSCYLEFIESR